MGESGRGAKMIEKGEGISVVTSSESLWAVVLKKQIKVQYLYLSLPADVLWGSFVTHSFVGEKWMRDKRTPKDVCGEATCTLLPLLLSLDWREKLVDILSF